MIFAYSLINACLSLSAVADGDPRQSCSKTAYREMISAIDVALSTTKLKFSNSLTVIYSIWHLSTAATAFPRNIKLTNLQKKPNTRPWESSVDGIILDNSISNFLEMINELSYLAKQVSDNDCLATLSLKSPGFAFALSSFLLRKLEQVGQDLQLFWTVEIDVTLVFLAESVNCGCPETVTAGPKA